MATSSVEELKGRISAGRYAVSSADVADEIVAKFALVRRVSRQLREDEDERAAPRGGERKAPGRWRSAQRRTRVS
jgi:Anti-sigma-28 factor, FlgM